MLLKHLDDLEQEINGIRSGSKDIEYIHRARVASRRLRTAISLFEYCYPAKQAKLWTKQIRTVTQALGEARDTDVQIEELKQFYQAADRPYGPGIRRLLLRMGQKRAKLQNSVLQSVEQLGQRQVLEHMRAQLTASAGIVETAESFTLALYQRSYHAIHQRAAALQSFQSIVEQPEKKEELHEMRIAAKWLRYSLETFAPLYPAQLKSQIQATRKFQELLGEIHDRDVWIAFLPRFIEDERQRTLDYFGNARSFKRVEPGILFFQQTCLEKREESYQAFLRLWQKGREANLWVDLDAMIQATQFSGTFPDPV